MKSIKTKLVVITAGLIIIIVCALTYTIVWNAANILQAELRREISQNMRQGVAVFSSFLERQAVNLELWNAQPIVKVFFTSPALASLSRPGLESYFSQARANAPWIANIWLVDNGTIIYDHANLLDQPSGTSDLAANLVSQFSGTAPFLMNMQQFSAEQKQWALVLTHPFSDGGAVLQGKFLVLILDLTQVNESLFTTLSIGHQGFITLVGITPDSGLVIPEQHPQTSEQQDFAQVSTQWRAIADIPESYRSVIFTHQGYPDAPITLLGVASRNYIRQPIRRLMMTSIVIGVCVLIAGLGGAIVFAEKLTASLRILTEIVGGVTTTSVSASIALEASGLPDTQDELGVLAKTFSMMFAKIQEYTAHLEEKVAQRTQELKHAKDAAESSNKAKSAFLANMSHELRTPLNAILGFAQLMMRAELTGGQTMPPEHLESIGVITRSGEHLLTLINDVLDMSKIEAGRTTLNEQNFDLYRLLDDLEDMLRLRAEEKGLQLLFERHPNVPQYLRTDEIKLRQVLINLLNNALKFTEEGGVAVRISDLGFEILDLKHSPSQIPGSSHLTSHISHLKFEIEDTGPGIAADELDSLFEAFVQTKTGRESREGTGLGLPISRKFVQLMGGEMTVSSQVGKGTRFSFTIQAELVAQTNIDKQQSVSKKRVIALESGQPRYRILIVDDRWTNRQLLNKLLTSISSPTSGFDVREAENGQEAIEIWQSWAPHLIWMDMRMPVVDGYEATRQIKGHLKGQSTAIIALTASSFEEERTIVLSAGCDDFLRKPFRTEEIFDLLGKHLGVRYVYAESEDHPAKTEAQSSGEKMTSQQALAALPVELMTTLEQAVAGSDMEMIDQIIAEIRTHNGALADELAELANSFAYKKMLMLIRNTGNDDNVSGENTHE